MRRLRASPVSIDYSLVNDGRREKLYLDRALLLLLGGGLEDEDRVTADAILRFRDEEPRSPADLSWFDCVAGWLETHGPARLWADVDLATAPANDPASLLWEVVLVSEGNPNRRDRYYVAGPRSAYVELSPTPPSAPAVSSTKQRVG